MPSCSNVDTCPCPTQWCGLSEPEFNLEAGMPVFARIWATNAFGSSEVSQAKDTGVKALGIVEETIKMSASVVGNEKKDLILRWDPLKAIGVRYEIKARIDGATRTFNPEGTT